jgi:hypothetical protein
MRIIYFIAAAKALNLKPRRLNSETGAFVDDSMVQFADV